MSDTPPCKHFFGGISKGDAKRICHWCGEPEVLSHNTALVELRRSSQLGTFGPAMRAITDMQQRFVIAMLDLANGNYTEAAKVAGYSPGGSEMGLRSTAYRLAHDEKVQAAIQEESQKRLNVAGMMALNRLIALADGVEEGGKIDRKVQLKAVEMVLNRSGLLRFDAARPSLYGFEMHLTLMHPTAREQGAFIPLIISAIYAGAGVWVGLRYVVLGAIIATLTLFGFFEIQQHFALWMAAVGGGGLIVAGLWMRSA